jgi:protein-disulfide isomerase
MTDPKFAERFVYGEVDAPATMVEFGDFECPYCAAAAPVLHDLVESSDGMVRLVFRHFPLFQSHPFALTAALAAEAAGAQGSFWPMHDLLFAHQDRLADQDLVRLGTKLDLDTSTMVGDPAQRYAAAIQADYADGAEMGVHGTPTLFLNEVAYTGRVEVKALRAAVLRSLRQQPVQ